MKNKILKEFEELGIRVGDLITPQLREVIREEVENPAIPEEFWEAWRSLTNDSEISLSLSRITKVLRRAK